jgi:hypothetical protein
MPDILERYVEPSISKLAAYSLNENENVHNAARVLLQGTLERSSNARRATVVRQWTAVFQQVEVPLHASLCPALH